VLFEDGVYREFAVFEEEELKKIDIPNGSFAWQENGYDGSWIRFDLGAKTVSHSGGE